MSTFDPAKMKFLIVDDMDNMRRSIRAMLKLIKFGNSYYEAANGKEAWDLITRDKFKFDFIISDWYMPKMTGVEFLCKIRESKEHRDTPFLMITAETNQSIIAEAAEYEVDAYMTKPFVTATLEQKITDILRKLENPPPFKALLRMARDLREEGNIPKAIACAKKAAELNKQSSRPLRELGQLYVLKNEPAIASKLFEKAIELNRMDITSYHCLGENYFKQGEIDKAIANYSIAVELSPRNTERALKFAEMLVSKQKLDEAKKIFQILIKNNQQDLELLNKIGETCFNQELYVLSAKAFQIILKADKSQYIIQKKLGKSYQKCGHSNEAVKIFEDILKDFPEDIDAIISMAQTYLDLKLPARADIWASKARRIDPNNKEAQEILNRSY